MKKSLFAARDGSVASQAMLGGLARCAGCGHTLKITGSTKKSTGEGYAVYYCTGRYASGSCEQRANVAAAILDEYVEARVFEELQKDDGFVAQAVAASEQVEQLARAVTEAEHELDLYVQNPKLLSLLGEQKFVEGVEIRQVALDDARERLGEALTQSALAEELADGDLIAAWPSLSVQEKRRLMHGLLERVGVTRAVGRRKHANPIAERAQIILRGDVVLSPAPKAAARKARTQRRRRAKAAT